MELTRSEAVIETGNPIEIFAVRWRFWILGLITLAGAIVRGLGIHDGTLFKDDAWVALSARVPFGTALHMLVTTPGFTLFERFWIGLDPSASWFAQLPSFVASVAAIPVIYALVKSARFATWLALLASLLTASCVTAIAFGAHVKPYAFDTLLAALIIGIAQRTITESTPRSLTLLGILGVLTPWWSLSLAVVVIGSWVVLALVAIFTRRHVLVTLLGAIASALSILIEHVVLKRQQTHALTEFWHSYFIETSGPSAFVHSLTTTAWRLLAMVTIDRGGTPPLLLGLAALLVWVILIGLAARRVPVAIGVLAAAAVSSADHLSPLGTQRTDLYLLPAILLIVVAAIERVVAEVSRRWGTSAGTSITGAILALSLVSSLSLMVVVAPPRIRIEPGPTPDTMLPDLRPAHAAAMAELQTPGTILLVEESLYEWAYSFMNPIGIVYAPEAQTSFGVTGPHPHVILPEAIGSATQLWLRPSDVTEISRATRLITLRPNGEHVDPLAPKLANLCWLPVSNRSIGSDVLTTYHQACTPSSGSPLKDIGARQAPQGPTGN